MKKFLQISLAALALLALPQARAWTYADGDVLLVFRDGSHDVEFDIGNISQFTGKTNGYTLAVTNWSFNLVTNTFGADVTTNGDGVTVALIASTGSTNAWLSSSDPNTTAYNPSVSGAGNTYGLVNSIGISPKIYVVPTNNFAQSYVIGVTGSGNAGKYKYASYDYIVSGGTYNGLSELGGNSPFIVEQNIPGTLNFWAIQPTGSTPQPPDGFVGTFNITTNGGLTFVAGPPPTSIISLTQSGVPNTLTNVLNFASKVGVNYSLIYTNALGGSHSNWPVVSGPIVGDGYNDSLSHTTSGNVGFYQIVAH